MKTHTTARAYLVTLWTYGMRPTFADARHAALFCRVLSRLRQKAGLRVHAWVILPDRVRLILSSADVDARWVSDATQRLKSRFARELNARSGRLGLVWQDAEQRLPLRDAADIARRAAALHRNPVLEGLARDPRQWRYSSWKAWHGFGCPLVPVDLPAAGRGDAAADGDGGRRAGTGRNTATLRLPSLFSE